MDVHPFFSTSAVVMMTKCKGNLNHADNSSFIVRNQRQTGTLQLQSFRPRYVIRGPVGENPVDVVCRFRSDGGLLIIITVYVVD